jgi:hypothetical protein
MVHTSLEFGRGRFALGREKAAKLFIFNAKNSLSPAREFGQCIAIKVNVGPVGRLRTGKAETRGTAVLLMRSGRDEWDCLSSRTDNRTSINSEWKHPLLKDRSCEWERDFRRPTMRWPFLFYFNTLRYFD